MGLFGLHIQYLYLFVRKDAQQTLSDLMDSTTHVPGVLNNIWSDKECAPWAGLGCRTVQTEPDIATQCLKEADVVFPRQIGS
jgi:hypothetical protein